MYVCMYACVHVCTCLLYTMFIAVKITPFPLLPVREGAIKETVAENLAKQQKGEISERKRRMRSREFDETKGKGCKLKWRTG